jgi:hypothetical protein
MCAVALKGGEEVHRVWIMVVTKCSEMKRDDIDIIIIM